MLVAVPFLHNAGPGAGAESWMSLWGQVQTRRYLFFGNSGGAREGTDVSEALERLRVVTVYQSIQKYFDILITSR